MSGITILKEIRQQLLSNDKLTALIDNKVYPYIVEEGTTFPFIVMRKTNLIVSYCKDGSSRDSVIIQLIITDRNYSSTIDIAEEVRKTLERRRFGSIVNIELAGNTEDYINDAFICTLTFQITL